MTIEEKAIEYANKKVPNPSNSVAPYYTTVDMWEDSKQDYIQGAKWQEEQQVKVDPEKQLPSSEEVWSMINWED